MCLNDKAKHVSQCLELAVLLESSADKPGNVNRTNSFERTSYEHFLASAVAIAPSFERAAEHGVDFAKKKIQLGGIGVGQIIKECMAQANEWQHGGNTLLGTVTLLSPIAVAAGMAPARNGLFEMCDIRENVKLAVEATTPQDAVDFYEAVRIANPGGLGVVSELDVNDSSSADRIRKEKISLHQIFQSASKYDTICSEWVNNYPITFDDAYPSLMEQLRKHSSLNDAVVQTFLKVLAEHPDTLIARKTNLEKARETSLSARNVLKLGGRETVKGRELVRKFDQQLRKADNLLNPGTTADIVAAALALAILGGYRP